MKRISVRKPRAFRLQGRVRSLSILITLLILLVSGLFISSQVTHAASSYCQVTYSITNQWPGGFGSNIVIQNTSSSAWTNWTLAFTFPASGQSVTQGWNGTFTQSGQNVTVTNASWNGSVAANATVNPGFNGAWTSSNPVPASFTVNGNACNGSSTVTPTAGTTPTATATTGRTPTVTPVTPTVTPTAGRTPTATPTATGSEPNIDRYFPPGTSVSAMISGANSLSQQQIKVLVEQQVQEYWGVIQSTFGFTTLEKAYGFFLGQATRESTLQGGLETGGSTLGSGTSGSGSAGHSYGPLQAAETAYLNTNSGYQTEYDVPEIYQYDLVPQNFYDIGISIHMGIRHLIHFARLAEAAGYSGVDIARYGLAGYNTGQVTNSGVLSSYSDEIGALAGWYINNGHLYDTAWTWTGDPRVDRSSPWGWYP
ncbi:MAG TPA: cellulose-binding domain-containing protein [Ktedonobacteraceae bacterium]|nr:cellulose-binding domain-containing protein [Ktedonobacteraceae bacterium]